MRYGDGELPDQLLVAMETGSEAGPAPVWLQLAFFPGLEEPWLLQHYAPLPCSVPPGARAGMCRFLNRLNANLPIGGFGLLEERGEVFFRYTALLDAGSVPPGVVRYLQEMVEFLVATFGALIGEVAAGLGFETAEARLASVLEELPGVL